MEKVDLIYTHPFTNISYIGEAPRSCCTLSKIHLEASLRGLIQSRLVPKCNQPDAPPTSVVLSSNMNVSQGDLWQAVEPTFLIPLNLPFFPPQHNLFKHCLCNPLEDHKTASYFWYASADAPRRVGLCFAGSSWQAVLKYAAPQPVPGLERRISFLLSRTGQVTMTPNNRLTTPCQAEINSIARH